MPPTALRHILLIEDDPDIQEVVRMVLEMIGRFAVTACSSEQEALECVTRAMPDMVLLDFMMPGMDGAETLAALRAIPALAAVRVVFIIARARPDEIEAFRRLGAAGVITKPFDPISLPAQLRALWAPSEGG